MGKKSIKIRSKDYGLFIDLPDGGILFYNRECGEFSWVQNPVVLNNVKTVELKNSKISALWYEKDNQIKNLYD